MPDSPSAEPERTVIEVTYRDGAVEGPTSFTVTQGDRVRIIVHADVSDEVHFHGYDLMADVTPEEPARIDFVADAAGRVRGRARGTRGAALRAGDRSLIRRLTGERRSSPRSLATFLATATPALAHGTLAGRRDLPVPLWLFVFGAAAALIISFVALSALWTEPRFEDRPLPRARPSWLQSVLTNHALEWAIRIVMLLFFLVVTMASARRASATETIGPIVVYDWFWVGLTIAHALLGNLWATLSPFDTIGRLVGFDRDEASGARPYPPAWGRWPAAILLFGFVWVELADPFGTILGHLGLLIMVYTLIQIAGMHRYGRQTWLENGEAFGVYFGLIAGDSAARAGRGRVGSCSGRSSPASRRSRPGRDSWR